MRTKTLTIAVAGAALLAAAAWFGWRWHTTPVPPFVPVERAEKAVAEAVTNALAGVRSQPRSGEAWGKLGLVLAANGYADKSVGCFDYAERFDPDNPRWLYMLAVHLPPERAAEELVLLRRAARLEREPARQSVILYRLAGHAIDGGQLDEAAQHLEAMRKLDPDDPRVSFGLGLLASARDDPASARDHLSGLTDNAFFRKQACSILAGLPQPDPGLAKWYEQRSARLPSDTRWPDPYLIELGDCAVGRGAQLTRVAELQKQKRFEEAIDLLQQLAQSQPDDEVYGRLATTLLEVDRPAEAAQALRLAIRLETREPYTYFLLGALLLKQGEMLLGSPTDKGRADELFREALTAEDRALALKSDHGFAHLARARILKHLGRAQESLQALRQAVLHEPQSADAHLYLGEALAEAGDVPHGLEHLEIAAKHAAPGDPRAGALLMKWREKAKSPG